MGPFALRRLLLLLPQALGIATLIFVLFRLVPGDPATIVAGPGATQPQIEALRRELGLDRPLWAQYARFLGDLTRGDLGTSLSLRQPVTQVLAARLAPSAALMAASLLLTVALAVPAGVAAAVRPHSTTAQVVMGVSVLALSIPNFLLGMILMHYLSVRWRLLPAAGTGGLAFLVMPTLAIAARLVALVSRTTRASVMEVLGEDFVRTARAKGLAPRVVLYRHALRPALVPIITMIGLQAGYLLGGSIVVETLFAYQGLGQAMITAVSLRDYFLVQGITLLYVVGFLLVNLVVDLSYAAFDPRIRYA
ncbi:MAG: ABC transporter permease [Armatimonadota bacterium]|nr:ABC transporter permease [Armatimonadota bacterium]MDR7455296.1 ABC transporter permease [Armatimonadota bacterium]MDR7456765.1 ABC transporter permease [Armatimonadota bacterium]MDR7497009.1 ABC transporter permease [Armatimonadota bacterium]MDR7510497.1 ABC transporter permease [Armatimonadota bacterium]